METVKVCTLTPLSPNCSSTNSAKIILILIQLIWSLESSLIDVLTLDEIKRAES